MSKRAFPKTPKVVDGWLYTPDCAAPLCAVGSMDWFCWLATAVSFRYQSGRRLTLARGYGPPLAPISLRKEARRQGSLWYAYRRCHGVLCKRYVGKSEALTVDRLDELAWELSLV